jgi:ribonuclease HI
MVYVSKLEILKNNSVELAGLLRGMVIAQTYGFSSLEVEGGSQLIIRALQKVLNGVMIDKVSQHWRMIHGITELGRWVHSLATIILEMMHRKDNSTVDCMANLGVSIPYLHQLWWSGDPLLGGTYELLEKRC